MSRVQLALNVADLDDAIDFYSKLFGTAPAKVRPGYANFAVTEPPLKLILIADHGDPGTLNHLGVEVESRAEVGRAAARLRGEGFALRGEEGVTCCHAVQDKVFVSAPDVPHGWWEFYAVTDDNPANPDAKTTSECAVACESQSSSACCA